MFIPLLLGIFSGIITGLIPGIHINLISTLLVSVSPLLLGVFSLTDLVIFIISMSVVHSFVDAIPSIFLGAPDPAYAASMLPGHRLLQEGRGYEAVYWTVVGSFVALIAGLFFIPFLIKGIPIVYTFVRPYLGYILVAIVLFMILKDKRKLASFVAFFLAGSLGVVVLNMNLENPLLPLLSGLFGISLLLISLWDDTSFPKQNLTILPLPTKETMKAVGAGTVAGTITSIFPGLGSAQGAVLALQFFKEITSQGYLILTGAINTVNFVLSLVTLYTLDKARNGSIVAVKSLVESIGFSDFIFFILLALFVGAVSVFISLYLARKGSSLMNRLPYKKVVISVISLIVIVVVLLTSWIGLIILILSTAVGIIIQELGVPKHLGMGCLLLPVILFFLL